MAKIKPHYTQWAAQFFAAAEICLEFGYEFTRGLFAPKLTFLALVIAVGTFQYRVWRDLAQWFEGRPYNPDWLRFRSEVETWRKRVQGAPGLGVPVPGGLPALEKELERWEHHKEEVKKEMRGDIIPHNQAILGDLLFIATGLLISTLADIVLFLTASDLRFLRAISTGVFAFSFVPFFDIWWRYFVGLRVEFSSYREMSASKSKEEARR